MGTLDNFVITHARKCNKKPLFGEKKILPPQLVSNIIIGM